MFGPRMEVEYVNPKGGSTTKLVLEPPADETAAIKKFVEWLNDNRVRQYLSLSYGLTESSERDWMTSQSSNKEDLVWMIIADGELAGSIGLHRIDFTNRQAELGIVIGDKNVWGKGIAAAAEIAVIDYTLSNIVAGGLHKVWARVFVGNGASQHVIEKKLGFRTIGIKKDEVWCNGSWYDVWVGEMLQQEWQTKRKAAIKAAGITTIDLYPGIEKR